MQKQGNYMGMTKEVVGISTKYKAIKEIKVPKWAEWEKDTKLTHLYKVKELV